MVAVSYRIAIRSKRSPTPPARGRLSQWSTAAAREIVPTPARPRPRGSPPATRRSSGDRGRASRARGDDAATSASREATNRRLCAAPPVSTPARGEVECAGQGRERGGIEDESRARRAGHLEPVSEQPEPGDVGRGAHDPFATRTSDAARLSVRIRSIAPSRSLGSVRPCRRPLTSRPVPSRLVRMSASPGSCAALAQQPVRDGPPR